MSAHVPDTLLFRGKTWPLCAQPLESYLGRLRKSRRPQFAPRSTANRRGYTATWEIQGDMLHLVGLEGSLITPSGVVDAALQTALPWIKESIAATWVTEDLRCIEGRLLTYVHAGYGSRYERDRLFRFQDGRLVDEFLVLNPPNEIIYRIAADGTRTCIDAMGFGQPGIPEPPSRLPQQRIYEVVPLAPRPDVFNFEVGCGDFPAGVVPRQAVPRSPDLIVQVEWAETLDNYGVQAFYLHARKACWILWSRTLNDNTYPFEGDWQAVGYCNRKGIDRTAAATHLLLEYWKFERERGGPSPDDEDFNWINKKGFLSIADVRAIVRELDWQRGKSG